MNKKPTTTVFVQSTASNEEIASSVDSFSNVSNLSGTSSINPRRFISSSMENFVDRTTPVDQQRIDERIADFYFRTAIPF